MKNLLITLFALVLAFSLSAQETLKREMRTVWIATVSNIDWPQTRGTGSTVITKQKKQLTDMLDGFAKTNMNGVCLQVRPMADALYKSSYEPWSSYITGTRGKDPGWDPLAFAVEECHKRGIECHAWVNPYRFSNSGGRDCTTAQDQALKNSDILMAVGDRVVFNPGLKASRERLLNVCREMIENYDIDGIIFDDYFYPGGGTPEDSSAPDYDLWHNSGTTMSIGDWRRANVNLMVKEMYEMVQATKPYVKFAIGPAGASCSDSNVAKRHGIDPLSKYCRASDWQYNQIYSDCVQWLEDGTIDYISPQLYWKTTHTTNPFGPMTQWWSYVADHFNRHHYASTNIYFMESTNSQADWDEINAQVLLTRQYARPGTSGVNFYSAKYINGPKCTGLGDFLAKNTFTRKAIIPCLDWKQKENLGAPVNVQLSGNTLSWNAVDKHLVRYAVYAVPTSVPVDQINSSLYGGIKGDYLLNVTYSPSFTLDSKYLSGYWYAVTVVDGWGNEFAPTYVNAPAGDSEATTLVSPVGGATVDWNQTFAWTPVDNAKFHFQVAADADFKNILIDKADLTATSSTENLIAFESLKTYYWRVITSQEGHFDKASTVETFTTPQHPKAPVVTLISPADRASVDDDFSFTFSSVGATGYTVQVAATSDFVDILFSSDKAVQSGNTVSIPFAVSLVGKGTYYWRVVTRAAGCDDSMSESRSFNVTRVPVGEFEPGYVMKKDIDTYNKIGNLELTNKWVRSIKGEYGNMAFDSNGLMNRGFAVKGNRIYVIGRSEGSSSAQVYIDHYSTDTGERIKRVSVDAAVQGLYYPGNDIFLDAAGNLCVSNLVLDIKSYAMTVFQVDPETGSVIERARVTTTLPDTKRIDHCNVYGDVSSNQFYVFAAMSSGTQVVRWTITNGAVSATNIMTARAYSPSTAGGWSIAPRVYPVSPTQVYVKGASTYVTLYNFSTGAIIDSMDGNDAIKPIGRDGNGFAHFTFGSRNYMLYPHSSHRDEGIGYRYILIEDNGGNTFADYAAKWIFPTRGLGEVNSSTWDAPCQVVDGTTDREKDLYIYVPGNGLAAYTLRDTTPLLGDVNLDGEIDVTDVNCIINVILGHTNADVYEGRADINGDGDIDVSDINLVISIIIRK